MDQRLLEALGVEPEAAEAILAVHREEMEALPPPLQGVPVLAPPPSEGAVSREALSAMSLREINESWPQVAGLLSELAGPDRS